ncbi:KR domain-containing protein [Streptomyces sp. NA02950]|uniref:type I polyketide synthase n=1 Tax=Streptomyces sp. NA02950 TaxID=2742137 RepID=UPI00159049C7|nr:type I polyketide synthase [Streptomyces sp. NA02950]QKV97135.1 KR domain-containing protein [Streptomyces sp. NA02950]
MTSSPLDSAAPEPVAVISMSGRFPGADTVEQFWANVSSGIESIARFPDPAAEPRPRFVGAEGVLGDIAGFDAEFFGYSPKEAEVMDPQHRMCLEAAWTLFDTAGYDPATLDDPVGVFVSSALSSYLVRNLLPNDGLLRDLGGFPLLIHNDKDFAATTISYKLGLTGPSVSVGSACSSSLVAVHLAARSLQSFECDMAAAGGVSLQVPQAQGYIHAEGSYYSADGRCAAFDRSSSGTVGASGVGLVLLKRLADAQRDGDRVHAVLLGSAVNNDGGHKAGYTAPGVRGQRDAIVEAHAAAGISAESVGYVEAHGTGTAIGDPIEVEALTAAFRATTDRTGFCALGSVKTNVGHLDAAAGVAGLIKAIGAVRDGVLPATLHYEEPNPAIDFARSPFYVSAATAPWPVGSSPRRAGVSSFGIGGTNAHVVLEQPPAAQAVDSERRPVQPLLLSARSAAALDQAGTELAEWLLHEPGLDLADVSATLAGRRAHRHRRVVVAASGAAAASALRTPVVPTPVIGDARAAFLFSGQGNGYPGMAAGLSAGEPAFRRHLDECARLLAEHAVDLRALLDVSSGTPADQIAGFSVSYSLAQTLIEWGVEPVGMVGHSVGEYVAAAVAGVFSLPTALRLVVARSEVQSALPEGRMLAVPLGADELRPVLDDGLALAAINAPDRCVVSGTVHAVEALAARLTADGLRTTMLAMRQAGHSDVIGQVLDLFRPALSEAEFHAPHLPFLSTVTGDWADPADVAGPEYWLAQMRRPVLFDAAVQRLAEVAPAALVELGPGTGLGRLAARRLGPPTVFTGSCLPPAEQNPRPEQETEHMVRAVGAVWARGCPVDWTEFHRPQRPLRTHVPGYPFQHERYWIEAPGETAPGRLAALLPEPAVAGPVPDDIDDHPGLRSDLEALCRALLLDYLRAVGIAARAGERLQVAELRAALGLAPELSRFGDFLVAVLSEDGVVDREGDTLTFRPLADTHDSDRLHARLVDRHPGFEGLADLLVHCAAAYPEALRDPRAAVGVLHPGADGALLRRELGERTVEYRSTGALGRMLGDVLERLAAEVGRPLRVLEVGAGEGTLTQQLATRLGPQRVQYHATDLAPLVVDLLADGAASRGVPLTTGVLDIDRDPAAQGYSAGYDLVCGLDVVHATPDVARSLRNLRSLLAPGGVLGLIETVRHDRWLPMIWGLTTGWWIHADRSSDHGPLLDVDGWREAFASQGFTDTTVRTAATGRPDAALILATAPAVAPVVNTVGAGQQPVRREDPGDWTHLPGWRHAAPAPAARRRDGTTCLLLSDGPLGQEVASRLDTLGVRAVFARADPAWSTDQRRYRELLADLAAQDRAPQLIVHLWPYEAAGVDRPLDLGTVKEGQLTGLHSLLHLAQAIGAETGTQPVRLVSVTRGAQAVLGDLAHPEHATVASAVKVIPRELPRVSATAIDVDAADAGLADRVVAELLDPASPTEVAYRGRQRFERDYHPLPFGPARTPEPGGVYLICGGLGGIGLSVAEYLAPTARALVLTRRTPFPEPEDRAAHPAGGDTERLAERLAALTANGAELLLRRADVADEARMREVVAETESRFGPITGVVHAAGAPDTAGLIQRRDRHATDEAMASKVLGPVVLDTILGDRRLDFFVLCSSIGSVLHKLKFGEVGYVAGNDFLDAFAAHRAARRPGQTVSIGWTDWTDEAGMWATVQEKLVQRYDVAAAPEHVAPGADLLGAISRSEGTELFARILAGNRSPRVLVCTLDLGALLARHEAFSTDDHRAAVAGLRIARSRRDRTALSTVYREPGTPVERGVAACWAALLGDDPIGADDDFFELGGDSLVALRLLSAVRERYGVELSMAQLFDAPTISGQAAAIEHGASGRGGEERGDEEEVLL